MLPLYKNVRYTSMGPSYGLGRWRIVLSLMAITILVCFVMFFFLPENSLKQPMRAIPVNEFLLPNVHAHHRQSNNEDVHIQMDRERLVEKMQESQVDQPEQKQENEHLENLHEIVNQQQVENMMQRVENVDNNNEMEMKRVLEESQRYNNENYNNLNTKDSAQNIRVRRIVDPEVQGLPKDEETRQRRNKVKEMMKHAWDNYARYAWGDNELKPISKQGHSAGIFGESKQGATIVDGLDTLYLMGLHEDFKKGRDWIAENLDLANIDTEISVFETNIRFIGGLLTLFAFTNDDMFKQKADEIATALLPAFDTKTGIPYALINPKTKKMKNYAWSSGGASILAEFGTMHLEFDYLSEVTGKTVFRDKINKIRQKIYEVRNTEHLYRNYLHPQTGSWGQDHVSMGGLGDSFYEYLLKAFIQSDGTDVQAKQMFKEAMDAVEKYILKRSERERMLYLADMRGGKTEAKMDHLACFSGGLFALASTHYDDVADKYLNIGMDLTHTCHESYNRSATGLGPEAFRFSPKNGDAKAIRPQEKYYILRPEVIESYFYLWRLTKDPKYREWGWEAVQALEKHCRTENGYSGLRDVYNKASPKDDVQQSFFLAETLKYLYLLFSEDDLLAFDEWVFNTEAHPLPILRRQTLFERKN